MNYIVDENFIETFENTLITLRCYAGRDGDRKLADKIDKVLEEIEKVKEENEVR